MITIKYNSPVILTYAICSIFILTFSSDSILAKYFTSPAHLSFSDPVFYIRTISYIAGHSGWNHLTGNFLIILLVGPLLEEKHGSVKLLEMIIITAISTALLNAFLFSNSLIGASGVAFMLILLSSFSNIKSKQIPLTFILIATLYIGFEIISMFKSDRISQFSHLAGGFTGAAYGFLRNRKK